MKDKKPLEKLINTYDKKPRTPLKIGVCLSGGAIRGLAHVGVLRVLYNEFIPIDLIAGSSAGSVVAGLYALYGYHSSWAVFEKTLKKNSIFRVKKNKDDEFFDSAYFKRWLKELFGDATFNDVKIPLEVTALDIISGKTIYISDGYLRDAIYASCAVPGVWKPAKVGNMLLVDGSFGDDIPVEWLRNKGADVVIVSIVNFYNEFLYGTGLSLSKLLELVASSGIIKPFLIASGTGLEYVTRDISLRNHKPLKTLLRTLAIFAKNINRQKWGADADVKIVPDIGDFYSSNPGYLSTNKRSEVISAGAIATWKKIPQLKHILGEIKMKKELSTSASEKIKKQIKNVKASFLKLVG
jgi:NTE family protein